MEKGDQERWVASRFNNEGFFPAARKSQTDGEPQFQAAFRYLMILGCKAVNSIET
jgi:hypothetical protein